MGKGKSVQIKENNKMMFSPLLSFLGATTCLSRFSLSSWCSDAIYSAAATKSVPPTNSPTSSSQMTPLSPDHTMIFPPASLDSSSCWNTSRNQLQQISSNSHTTTIPSPAGPGDGGKNNTHPHSQEVVMATAAGGGGGDDGGCARNSNKTMSMPERARRARVPQPEPDLNCPRCDSTNTKFCYFNNYSLTQPRHYCRACRRYWTHGGALRTVPVGSGYRRRHTKRSAKPRATSADRAAVTRTSRTPSITACTTGTTTTVRSGLQYLPMFSSAPLFAGCFDPESLGLNFPARLLLADAGAADDDGHHHHQGNWNGMEQWPAAQMNNFPFLEAMDHQMFEPPAAAMPTTMPTTMVAMHDMFHLGIPSGGNGKEDGGHHQFHHHAMLPAKGDHQQQQQDYPSSRGTYGDIVNAGGGYNFYSSASNAAGN